MVQTILEAQGDNRCELHCPRKIRFHAKNKFKRKRQFDYGAPPNFALLRTQILTSYLHHTFRTIAIQLSLSTLGKAVVLLARAFGSVIFAVGEKRTGKPRNLESIA